MVIAESKSRVESSCLNDLPTGIPRSAAATQNQTRSLLMYFVSDVSADDVVGYLLDGTCGLRYNSITFVADDNVHVP